MRLARPELALTINALATSRRAKADVAPLLQQHEATLTSLAPARLR
jgi:hypothetical protein